VKRYISDKRRHFSREKDLEHVLIIPSDRDAVATDRITRTHEVRSPRLIGSRSYRILMNRKRILEIIEKEKPDLIDEFVDQRRVWIGLEAAVADKQVLDGGAFRVRGRLGAERPPPAAGQPVGRLAHKTG